MVAHTRGTPLHTGSCHHSLLLWARLSRGLAHVSSMHARPRMRARRPTSGRYAFRARAAHPRSHDGGALWCRLQACPRWWIWPPRHRPAYPNPHRKMLSLRKGGEALTASAEIPVSRHLLRVEVGAPRWWRSPTAATMVARPRSVNPPAPLAARSHRRQKRSSLPPASGTGRWFESPRCDCWPTSIEPSWSPKRGINWPNSLLAWRSWSRRFT